MSWALPDGALMRRPWRLRHLQTTILAIVATVTVLLVWRLYAFPGPTSYVMFETKSSVLNETLGFGKILVLNLPARTDRKDAMTLVASVSGLKLTWVDGVRSDDISDKALPPGHRSSQANWDGLKGSWRGHMNAVRTVVEERLASALIMEDDVDWDVRLKSQLVDFSKATRAYIQPYSQNRSVWEDYAPHKFADMDAAELAIYPDSYPHTKASQVSPYGDDWDVLWLGHVGTHFPAGWRSLSSNADHAPASLLSMLTPNDPTVPSPSHLKPHPSANMTDDLGLLFPAHTRAVHESRNTIGVQAYAVSQRGARRLLWKFGLDDFSTPWDFSLRDWCDGRYHGSGHGEERPRCLTVQPPLFSHHYAKGGSSDIQGPGGGYMRKVGTPYVRYSVRMNLPTLLTRGLGLSLEGLEDQWPDGGGGPW